ncbi:hypothetical protein Hypma_013748 [Hypsizygus marmoreus]|uniref:Homeobox domain-containing protein n=1 Tax=Hypsizygus marmoreus TaxID=39966 RepID=A0A369KAT7_HYPMA|nr:hypothetical protein Hypma_013748 [Hypsizygus marmoreus]
MQNGTHRRVAPTPIHVHLRVRQDASPQEKHPRRPASPTLSPPSHPSTQPQPQLPAPEHLLELTAIWNEDKRTPSVLSRRAWALARNLRVEAFHRWWHRRRQTAKRVGEMLLEETYELEVGTPPVLRGRAKRAKMEMQDSDETLVSSPRKCAYTHFTSSLPTSRSTSPLPPSSPPSLSSSPALSSPPPSIQVQLKEEWCNRVRDGPSSDLTCSLCSSGEPPSLHDRTDSLPPTTDTSMSSPEPAFVFPSPDEPLTPPVVPMRWCIVGRHYALNGSFIGRCMCGPVVWGGCELEDELCASSSSSVEDGLCPSLIDDDSHPLLLEEDELGGEA